MGEKGEGSGGKGGGNWEWGTPCPPPQYSIREITYCKFYIAEVDFGTLVYSINVLCVAMGVILDAYTDSNSADRICWSYSEEPSRRDVPLFSNSIVLLVQLVVLSLLLTESSPLTKA